MNIVSTAEPPNGGTTDQDELLKKLNREEVMRIVPLLIYLLIVCLCGLLGHTLVLFVYKTKYGPSNCRTFLLFLSVIDLISCVLGIPFEIVVVHKQFTFRGKAACKISVLLNSWPTLTSGFVLLAIAVDRYRKICQPFGWQISTGNSKAICALCVILAAAFSWLSPVIYDIVESKHPVYNITISECAEVKSHPVFPLVNSISFAVLFVGALVSMTILYCFIGAGVRAHARRRDKLHFVRPRSSNLPDTSEASEMTIKSGLIAVDQTQTRRSDQTQTRRSTKRKEKANESLFCSETSEARKQETSSSDALEQEPSTPVLRFIETPESDNQHTQNLNRKSVLERVLSFGRYSVSALSRLRSSSTSGGNRIKRKSTYRMSQVEQHRARKITFVMFLISVAFIVSYLPLLCILLIRSTHPNFVEGLSDHSRAAYKFFLRSYYLNCMVNPIIYGLWDAKFRKAAKRLFCCCSRRQ